MADIPIFVDDLRANNDPSLSVVPRVTSFDQLKSIFHLDILTSKGWSVTPANQLCYKLVGFYLRTGVAEYIPKLQDTNGNPLKDIVVFRNWPGAPKPPQTPKPDYFANAVGGFTNANGDAGFPYGGGSVMQDNGGPDNIWPAIDPAGGKVFFADCAVRLGWHGATDHLTPNPIFRVVKKSGDIPPPVEGEYRFDLIVNGVKVGYIPVVSESSKVSYLELFKGDTSLGKVEVV